MLKKLPGVTLLVLFIPRAEANRWTVSNACLLSILNVLKGKKLWKHYKKKSSWSRVGLGLKWQVQNISTLSKWKWLRIFTSREKWASKWKQSQVACTIRRSGKNLKRPVAKNPLLWTNESKWPLIYMPCPSSTNTTKRKKKITDMATEGRRSFVFIKWY